jgi:adenylate cyclase
MNIRPKTRIQLYQVLATTLFWMFCGAFLAVYKCVTYDFNSGEFIFIVPQGLSFGAFVLINVIGPTVGGLIGGCILFLYLNERLRHKSYGYFMLVTVLFFLALILLLNTGVTYFFYHKEAIAASAEPLHTALRLLLLDPYNIRNIITWLLIAILTLFGLRIYEKYGPGTIIGLLRGEYHRPHEVQRVFMFLDMNSSTRIAEDLGHVKFFQLLREFFADITDPILNSRGEIYQYVGDEIVISWPPKKAVSSRVYCIACFFRIEQAIQQRADEYNRKYGLVPTFKAGLHRGSVVVGEMGVIKREIVYSGDILNTTSRIMELCKVHDHKLIISQDIVDMIPDHLMKRNLIDPLGSLNLRGKACSIALYGVRQK